MNMLKINHGIHRLDIYSLLLTGGCLTLIFVILLWSYKKKKTTKHKDSQDNGDTVQSYISSPLVLKGRTTYSTPKNYGHTSRRSVWGKHPT